MDMEFSTLDVEPERIRVTCGSSRRLLHDPVAVVDEHTVEGGHEFVLRARSGAAVVVIAAHDAESLAVAQRLPRHLLDPTELTTLRQQIALARDHRPDPDRPWYTDEMRRRRAVVRRDYRPAITVALLFAVTALFAALSSR